jgi:hypothetical protein
MSNTITTYKKAMDEIKRMGEKTSKDKQIHIRINDDEKQKMLEKAESLGFKQLSEYLRFVGLNADTKVIIKEK